MMKTAKEIVKCIGELELDAEKMEYWDGEPDLQYHNGYIHALNWALGLVKAQYNKEDI